MLVKVSALPSANETSNSELLSAHIRRVVQRGVITGLGGPMTSPASANASTAPFLTLLEMLGEGSFGKVFKAMHHDRNEVVAVKVVSLEDDNGQLENEIELLKACKHSGIVQYFSSFVHQSKLWIVMEYCEGSSLLDVMSACGRCLTEPQTAAAVAACTHALQYLHEQRLVHRDIKAGNLLLDSDGIVKLADFGVAAIVGLTIAARRTVIGTPFWMAPEVITCQRSNPDGYDMLADVWSLGITAIEIAEGQPPHAQVSPLTAIFLIPTLPAPSLKEPASWSPEFVAMLKRCLVKNPAQRASSADLMSDPFIRHGHEAAARGVMRALMSAARDPLRAFRDKEERRARHAAEGRQRRKSAEDMRNPGAGAAAPLGAANTQYSSATLPRPKSGSGSGGGSGADVQRSSGSGGGARDDFDLAAISAIAKKFAEDVSGSSGTMPAQRSQPMAGAAGTSAMPSASGANRTLRLGMGVSAGDAQQSYKEAMARRPSDGDQLRRQSAPPAPARSITSATGTANFSGGTMQVHAGGASDASDARPAFLRAANAGGVYGGVVYGADAGGGPTRTPIRSSASCDGTMCICSGDGMIGATPSLQAACATAGGAAAPLSVRPRLAYDEPTPSAIGAAGGTLGRGFGVDETGDSTMCIRRADAEAATGAAASGTMVIKPAAAAALRSAVNPSYEGVGTMLLRGAGGEVATLGAQPPAFMRQFLGDGLGGGGGGSGGGGGGGGGGVEAAAPPIPLPPPQGAPSRATADSASGRRSSGAGVVEDPLEGSSRAAAGRGSLEGRNASNSRRRGDVSLMGVETLSKELSRLSEDMERDIGKVYRKYERLERQLRTERDRKLEQLQRMAQ
jgi:serine/threonine protein kinase